MTICLNKNVALNYNSTIDEVIALLVVHNKLNIDNAMNSLINKGLITAERNDLFQQIGWRLTKAGGELLDSVIVDSDKIQEPQDKLNSLAVRLKEIFPKGKKEGTNYYWAEGVALIIRRLKIFFKKYGNKYSEEQIIKAAETYVKSFNGSYQYMKLLKYFIFKEKVGAAGEIEGDSELLNYIENYGQEDETKQDWVSTLK